MTSHYCAQRIAELSNIKEHELAIELIAETASTNADLLTRIDGLSGPVLLIAENQTAGRGRAGRNWHSEPGSSITFSIAWKFGKPLSGLVGLSLAVGTALAESLAKLGIAASVKWPNDILSGDCKLAGILIEAAAARQNPQCESWAVVGIGVNLQLSDQLSARVGHPIAGASSLNKDRDLAVATLVRGLTQALRSFEIDGLEAFTERWSRLHAHAGKQVAILDGERVLHKGQAAGIDNLGRLLLDTADGRIAITAGDVSLRPAEALQG